MQMSASFLVTVPVSLNASPVFGSCFAAFDFVCAASAGTAATASVSREAINPARIIFIVILSIHSPIENAAADGRASSPISGLRRSCFSWKSHGSQPPYRRIEAAVQFFSRAALSQAEAHVSFHHHADLGARRDARRHGAHSCDLGYDRV